MQTVQGDNNLNISAVKTRPRQVPGNLTPERYSKTNGLSMREIPGSKRRVMVVRTTLDLLRERKQIPQHLRMAFDQYCLSYALAKGIAAAANDTHSTAKGISGYDGVGVADANFGPRALSNRQISHAQVAQRIEITIPPGMAAVFYRLRDEETDGYHNKPRPLTMYGNARGFNQQQQARSAGATIVYDVCEIVAHELKKMGF